MSGAAVGADVAALRGAAAGALRGAGRVRARRAAAVGAMGRTAGRRAASVFLAVVRPACSTTATGTVFRVFTGRSALAAATPLRCDAGAFAATPARFGAAATALTAAPPLRFAARGVAAAPARFDAAAATPARFGARGFVGAPDRFATTPEVPASACFAPADWPVPRVGFAVTGSAADILGDLPLPEPATFDADVGLAAPFFAARCSFDPAAAALISLGEAADGASSFTLAGVAPPVLALAMASSPSRFSI
ncbi:MAG TPA: hypothetical protein VGC09_09035 [Rhodopila sp.]